MTRTRAFGLSLVECLVALAILAIGITAAYRSIAVAGGQSTELRDRLLAEWVAQDLLAEHRALGHWRDPAVNEGEVEQGGVRFRYREEFRTTAYAPNNLRQVDIRVFRAGEDHALARMTGMITR
ncbi:type II secretion system minor pseudopilin GspI [Uliginosibacterium sp. H1]|uniref:type II secretion system minor pseudopilin GspI n=1 Tax=Uliginosibacterium sp. H1 TaxID=3114757 RepID=UPI002E17D16B|nr:type II secretion system minor pseudopilin GspI [Uliginosibacterium sp. H1]